LWPDEFSATYIDLNLIVSLTGLNHYEHRVANPSWETNATSASQEMSHTLQNLRVT